MIIIPELRRVLILTPRACSTSLKKAVLEKYPESMMIYRHMEADGVPHGYDRWEKLGVVRSPLDRLWSLYKYLKKFDGNYCQEYIKKMNDCVKNICFSDWVISNQVVFTCPYTNGKFYPEYTVNHSLPENKKSQFFYLRPDLGTRVFRFDRIYKMEEYLGVDLKKSNGTSGEPRPAISDESYDHVKKYFAWDLEQFE